MNVDIISILIALLFVLDRLLKLATVIHFFNRPQTPPPDRWPTISMVQPITRGAANLEYNLHSRLNLDYPVPIQYILVCDRADLESQAICSDLQNYYNSANIAIVTVAPDGGTIASKIAKMKAGLTRASGDVLCFIDDDIAPKPNAGREMIPHLLQPKVGATFALPCAVSWKGIWSSLMSAFVNCNALITYIPVTYFTEPFTITGHIFAITRSNFDAAGGLEDLADWRVDDDHELARRLKAMGLKSVQTPVIYKVSNEFDSLADYANQIQRWFVFPSQGMIPYLSGREKFLCYAFSVGMFLPSLAAILASIFPSSATILSLLTIWLVYVGVYAFLNRFYLQSAMPLSRWPLVLVVALVTPMQIIGNLLLSNNEIVWRGQRLRVQKGGHFEVIE